MSERTNERCDNPDCKRPAKVRVMMPDGRLFCFDCYDRAQVPRWMESDHCPECGSPSSRPNLGQEICDVTERLEITQQRLDESWERERQLMTDLDAMIRLALRCRPQLTLAFSYVQNNPHFYSYHGGAEHQKQAERTIRKLITELDAALRDAATE